MAKILERPVLIHSLWRCASTYFMEKFSAESSVVTYTEPFNEQLVEIDSRMIEDDDRRRREELNHLDAGQSYFGSYRELIVPEGSELSGVQGFDLRFPLNYWFDKRDRGQLRYLRSLIEHAADRHQSQAVLGFVRSLGRMELLQKLNGYNIVLVREPFGVFWSNCLQQREKGNSYFAVQYILLATLCRKIPALNALATHYQLPKVDFRDPNGTIDLVLSDFQSFYGNKFKLQREAFCLIYLLSYSAALPYADLVVSVDRLSRDAVYRENISALIANGTGHELDFSDCQCPSYDEPEARAEFYKIYRSQQMTLSEGKASRWLSGGELLDSLWS